MMESTNQDAVRQLRAEVITRKNLPTIPTVVTRILRLLDAESTNGRELVDVIEHDQALTAKLLRLANSAFFGQARRVSTIPRAVVLLGFSTVRLLALGVKVFDSLGNGVSRQRVQELWRHAVTVAVAGKMLGTHARAGDPDEAFTAGLLHDIGRLLLAMRFKQDYWHLVGSDEGDQIDALERTHFGVDHAEVGGWILEAWSLPQSIVEAVREHHAEEPRPGVPRLLAVTDRLVAWTDLQSGVMRPEAQLLLQRIGEVGITPEAWDAVVTELRTGEELQALSQVE
jgi:putative nucleotidyltransferase with HDIG domain